MAENTSVAERNGPATDERTKRSQFASWLAMTSYRQVAANRRNAIESTGPKTEVGKQRSRCNALRHGLTAETVVAALEDAEDYKAFRAAITADYDAQSAVEAGACAATSQRAVASAPGHDNGNRTVRNTSRLSGAPAVASGSCRRRSGTVPVSWERGCDSGRRSKHNGRGTHPTQGATPTP